MKDKKLCFLKTVIIIIFIIALIGPYFLRYDPNLSDISNNLQSPSLNHLFGTDVYGRDIFSRVIVASKLSLFASITIVLVSGIFGTFFGMISGYYGGKIDSLLIMVCDMFQSFPQMIIAIGVAGILGGGLGNAMIALAMSNWMLYARIARSAILKEKSEAYVLAAKFSGLSSLEIIFKQILVNIKDLIIVTMTLNFASILMGLAGLSFLGIGVQVPQAEWGSMINEGRLYLASAPWISFFPSIAVILVVFVFNLLGESLQEYYKLER